MQKETLCIREIFSVQQSYADTSGMHFAKVAQFIASLNVVCLKIPYNDVLRKFSVAWINSYVRTVLGDKDLQ